MYPPPKTRDELLSYSQRLFSALSLESLSADLPAVPESEYSMNEIAREELVNGVFLAARRVMDLFFYELEHDDKFHYCEAVYLAQAILDGEDALRRHH